MAEVKSAADIEQGKFLSVQSKVKSLTDEQLVDWSENGSHADAAFAEQNRRIITESREQSKLLRQCLELLLKIYVSMNEVQNAD